MARYILIRLGGLSGVLLVVSIVTFTLTHLIPGGPYDEEKMPLSEEAKANILRSYGLDQPLWQQYGLYLYVGNALRFEFGYSYQSPGETVAQLIGRVWTVSLQLGALTLAVAIPVGLGLGILAARHRNSWIDNFVTLLATAGIVLPTFVVGILLILLFSNTLHWLPTGGWDEPKTWFMPVVAYALGPAGIIARFTRTCVLEGIGTDYVRTARAKGLAEGTIMRRHVSRNAAIPILTIAGPLVPDLLTESIFIETIFRIPGLGSYFVTSVFQRDYPMIIRRQRRGRSISARTSRTRNPPELCARGAEHQAPRLEPIPDVDSRAAFSILTWAANCLAVALLLPAELRSSRGKEVDRC